MRAVFCVPVITAGTIGAALALGANTALAAPECLTQSRPAARQPLVLPSRSCDRPQMLVSQGMDATVARPDGRGATRNAETAGRGGRAARQAAARRVRPGDATHNGKIDARPDRATGEAAAQRV